jgi:hypothetical protein
MGKKLNRVKVKVYAELNRSIAYAEANEYNDKWENGYAQALQDVIRIIEFENDNVQR